MNRISESIEDTSTKHSSDIEFEFVRKYSSIITSGDVQARQSFLQDFAEEQLRVLRKAEDPGLPSIRLQWVPRGASQASSLIWTEPPTRIIFGSDLLLNLDKQVLIVAGYLFQSFIHQTSGFGPGVPIAFWIRPDEFPAKALFFAPEKMLYAIAGPSDRAPSQSELHIESIRKAGAAKSPTEMGKQVLLKPRLSFAAETQGAAEPSDADNARNIYTLYLHRRILSDVLAFVLGHELAHIRLGHLKENEPIEAARSREEEVAADVGSLRHLSRLSGYQLRSVISLFKYIQSVDPNGGNGDESHPLASGRLILLGAATRRFTEDPTLIEDLNAGASLLTKPVAIQLHEALHSFAPADLNITASAFSDFKYNAEIELLLSLDYSKLLDKSRGGSLKSENPETIGLLHQANDAELQKKFLTRTALLADVALRSQINPGETIRKGEALVSWDVQDGDARSEQVFWFDPQTERSVFRLRALLVAPPHWWCNKLESALEVDALKIVPRVEMSPSKNICFLTYPNDHLGDDPMDVVQVIANSSEGETLVDRLRILARGYQLLNAPETAVRVAEVSLDRFGDFSYETVIGLAEYYLEKGNPTRASEIVQLAIRQGSIGFGYYYFLGLGALRRSCDLQLPRRSWWLVLGQPTNRSVSSSDRDKSTLLFEAYDYLFRESIQWGEQARYAKAATEVLQAIVAAVMAGTGVAPKILGRLGRDIDKLSKAFKAAARSDRILRTYIEVLDRHVRAGGRMLMENDPKNARKAYYAFYRLFADTKIGDLWIFDRLYKSVRESGTITW
jgi:hypothetical protein